MVDRRMKDRDWVVADANGKIVSVDHANLAVQMDIRDELKRLNNLPHSSNFIAIPRRLAKISSNTANLPKVKKK